MPGFIEITMTGSVNGMEITPEPMLLSSIVVSIPISMIPLFPSDLGDSITSFCNSLQWRASTRLQGVAHRSPWPTKHPMCPDANAMAYLSHPEDAAKGLYDRLAPGCGPGRFDRGLLSAGVPPQQITLLEPSGAMLACSSDLPVEKIRGRLEALPFPDASFDIVTCAWAIETVLEPGDAVDELLLVLRPGGLLCSTFCAEKPACGVLDWVMKKTPCLSQDGPLARYRYDNGTQQLWVELCRMGSSITGSSGNPYRAPKPGLIDWPEFHASQMNQCAYRVHICIA